MYSTYLLHDFVKPLQHGVEITDRASSDSTSEFSNGHLFSRAQSVQLAAAVSATTAAGLYEGMHLLHGIVKTIFQ